MNQCQSQRPSLSHLQAQHPIPTPIQFQAMPNLQSLSPTMSSLSTPTAATANGFPFNLKLDMNAPMVNGGSQPCTPTFNKMLLGGPNPMIAQLSNTSLPGPSTPNIATPSFTNLNGTPSPRLLNQYASPAGTPNKSTYFNFVPPPNQPQAPFPFIPQLQLPMNLVPMSSVTPTNLATFGFPQSINMNPAAAPNPVNPMNITSNFQQQQTQKLPSMPPAKQPQSTKVMESDGVPPRLPKQLSAVAEEPDNQFDDRPETMTNLSSSESTSSETVRSNPSPTPIATPPPNHCGGRHQQYFEKQCVFIPKYPPRARLNVYVHQNITNTWYSQMTAGFQTPQHLYYFIDISTAMQINDGEMAIFRCNNQRVMFANYDLRHKQSKQILYAVIKDNINHAKKDEKWAWNLDIFMTADEIYNKFGVCHNLLPKSSRCRPSFKRQLQLTEQAQMALKWEIVHNVPKWCGLQKIKRKPSKDMSISSKISLAAWNDKCKQSWSKYPAIPIVVNENKSKDQQNNMHWIEWVKVIEVQSINQACTASVGISCKYNPFECKWNITSICLDRGDVENKHRLCALNESLPSNHNAYNRVFQSFCTIFNELQITEDANNAPKNQSNGTGGICQ